MEEEAVLADLELPEEEYPVDCYCNRELSWLRFNERVLEEARDPQNPLCEQLNFLSIFQSNLDEFFMVRVGTLYDQRKSDIRDNKSGMTCKDQLNAVLEQVRRMLKAKDRTYRALMKQVRAVGREVLRFEELSGKERHACERIFLTQVLPLLSPQIVSAKQPFPFLNNRDTYAVLLLEGKGGGKALGIIPCTNPVLKRLIPVNADAGRYVPVEELILQFAPRIFDRYKVTSSGLIRVIRNGDISIDDETGDVAMRRKDYRKAMERMIAERKHLGAIKLEYTGKTDTGLIPLLCKYLQLPKKHAFYSAAPLDLSFLGQIADTLSDDRSLFYAHRAPQASPYVAENRPMIDQIREKDIFLNYPYDSMRPFLRLLSEAAQDPEVISIRITLYRLAKSSQIVESLIQAAENGKEVTALVELRARFDEENNVSHSRELEAAGCRIIYGMDHIKVHSKLCLITRRAGDGVEYITQVGTGNYNEKTARLYTDYSLMTASRSVGEEAAGVFTDLALGQTVARTETLMAAPECLQPKILERLDRQIAFARSGRPAAAAFKLNSLTDKVLIDKLIEASRAGVNIRMLIRGISCLVPGIPGYTENIRICSIVGRYLEHGRIYSFGCDGNEEVYISSADLMTRNTLHRVEIAVPLLDKDIRDRLLADFDAMFRDNCKLRIELEDGTYEHAVPAPGEEPFNVQEFFAARAYRLAGTRLPETVKAAPAARQAPAAPEASAPAPAEAEAPAAAPAPAPEAPAAEPAPAAPEELPAAAPAEQAVSAEVSAPAPASAAPEQPAEEPAPAAAEAPAAGPAQTAPTERKAPVKATVRTVSARPASQKAQTGRYEAPASSASDAVYAAGRAALRAARLFSGRLRDSLEKLNK